MSQSAPNAVVGLFSVVVQFIDPRRAGLATTPWDAVGLASGSSFEASFGAQKIV